MNIPIIDHRIKKWKNEYLPQGTLRYRMVSGTFWMLVGTGLAQASTFIATLFAARLLGSEVFGKFGIIQSTLGLFSIVAGFGLGITNKRYIGELRDVDKKRCGEIIGFSTLLSWGSASILTLLLLVFSPWITREILKAPDIILELKIASGILLLNGLNEAQLGALSGLEEFKYIAIINVLRSCLTLITLITGVWYWKLPGLIGGMSVTASLVWVITGLMLRSVTRKAGISIQYSNLRKSSLIFRDFALPALMTGLLPTIVFWSARALLVQYPNGYTELGIITAAEQWLIIMSFIPGQITNVAQPILSNIYSTKNWKQFNKAFIMIVMFPLGIGVLIGLFIILITKWLPTVYGSSFQGLPSILYIMCLVGLLRIFGGSLGTLIATINRMWIGFGINILWGSILIISMIFLSSSGAMGFALSNLIAYCVHSILGLVIFSVFQSRIKILKMINV